MKPCDDRIVPERNCDGEVALLKSGRFLRVLRLRDEPYVHLNDPLEFLQSDALRSSGADVFTFAQRFDDTEPHYGFQCEPHVYAVLPVRTFDIWWNEQVHRTARNKARKAAKAGVVIKHIPFDDGLVAAIKTIYDESPIRQGKKFEHYGETLAMLRRKHETFLDRTTFVGAYCCDELIGFIKFVRGYKVASLMQIIAKISHRDKAPVNALIAEAVKICATEQIPLLHYGSWSQGGLGEFKVSQGFKPHALPTYYVPLNARGSIGLKLRLHGDARQALPQGIADSLVKWRKKLVQLRFQVQKKLPLRAEQPNRPR